MKLGHGFKVVLGSKEDEDQFLKLLKRNPDNYPMVAKVNTPILEYLTGDSNSFFEYIVSAKDGVLLNLKSMKEAPKNMSIFEVTQEDLDKI